jgi:hypothetical protein
LCCHKRKPFLVKKNFFHFNYCEFEHQVSTTVCVAFLSSHFSVFCMFKPHETYSILFCFFLWIWAFTLPLLRLLVLWQFGVNSNLHMLQICGMKPWTNDLELKYAATFTCLLLQYVCGPYAIKHFWLLTINCYKQRSPISHIKEIS